jgi:hypothetical protein
VIGAFSKGCEPAYTVLAEVDESLRSLAADLLAAVNDGVSLLIAISEPRTPKCGIVCD